MVLKRLKLPKFFNGVARTFPTHKHMGVGRGAGIWKSQQKWCFLKPKTKFHHFWPPVAKLLEYLQVASPGKILSDAHAHKHVKWHYFCEK